MRRNLETGDVEGYSSSLSESESLSGSDQNVRLNHSSWYCEPEAGEDDLEKDEDLDDALEEDEEMTNGDVLDSSDSVSKSVRYSSDWTGPSLWRASDPSSWCQSNSHEPSHWL